MTRIGTVVELWRYPVKSMGGERLERATLGPLGIAGDRGWALRDEAAAEIRGAKKLPELMRCAARYLTEPSDDRIPAAEMVLPDGTRLRTDAPDVHERLSAVCGRRVTLWPRRPAEDREHYRRGLPDASDLERELRDVFGRLDEEPLPDLSVFPPEIMEFVAPLGTYFDALPLHLLTTATLATLQRENQTARFDVRRFRPNVLIALDGVAADYPENAWTNRTLRVGPVDVAVAMPTPRCVMTTQAQQDLPKDPTVLRTVVRHADQNIGVYATPTSAGTIRVGDPITLE
jgi:uncharacterized protein